MLITDLADVRPAIVGLGYVGLPLAVEFGRHYPTVGFDINCARIDELRHRRDSTLEVSAEELAAATQLTYSTDLNDIASCNVYIVTVPTPIDAYKRPDMAALRSASKAIGRVIKRGDVVVYESTVYPGATEEVCLPIIEAESGLKLNTDFFAGYSPERINPGDKMHRLTTIMKVTSGSTPEAADLIDRLYGSIVTAGTHRASSIRVAEAAKVIENTQRDLNIALINELTLIFERMDIDTEEVLQAAGTKWNFLPFRPGLVGGHCIGVDPYYLTFKAQEIGYHPEIILAGRRINDSMGEHVVDRVVKLMTQRKIHVVDSKVLILGLSFKENCPDIRNTRVVDLVRELKRYHAEVDVHDPWVHAGDAMDRIRLAYGRLAINRDLRCHRDRRGSRSVSGNGHRRNTSTRQTQLRDLRREAPVSENSPPQHASERRVKVLVTGSAGFIGSFVAAKLLARGDVVVGIDNLNAYYDVALKHARLDRLVGRPRFRNETIDITHAPALRALYERERPDRIVHLAAQAGVRYSLENPQAYVDSNITGFLNVLECARHFGTQHLVYASSSSVYGANEHMPFSVDDSVDHPVSLYAATKKANELMAHTYSHLFAIPTTGLRFFTVYGPWGRPDMALFHFTRCILSGEPIDVFNYGHHRRDFTYVDDIVEGIVRVLDHVATPVPHRWTLGVTGRFGVSALSALQHRQQQSGPAAAIHRSARTCVGAHSRKAPAADATR